MSVVLSISSQVVRGHVGNSAAVHGLRAFGHEVWPVPTVILSNHPGHGSAAGITIEAPDIEVMIAELERHGWLAACDAVLTGYFRTPAQCKVAADVIAGLKQDNPDLIYCCDPVLGDDPGGLYVDAAIAAAMRDALIPMADLATPNRFELAWLSGAETGDAGQAVEASRMLGVPEVIATSVPAAGGRFASIWTDARHAVMSVAAARADAPHGIGDLMAALVLARKLAGDAPSAALGCVSAVCAHVLSVSGGRDELDLIAGLAGLDTLAPADVAAVGA